MGVDPKKLSELSPELWQRVSDLFDEVIELDEADRIQFIRTLWASEPVAAQELMALLVAAANVDKTLPLTPAPFDSALKAALSEPAPGYRSGQKFGAWTLEKRLGQGGMGEVWRATRSDGLYKAAVAIKLLRTDLSHDTLSRRFARERVVLARLNHPNIARLLDAGVENEQAFIVLELVDGQPLLDYVEAHAPRIEQRLRLIRDVTLAVEHAHHQHVLHRDLKPSNVLVTRDGQVKLLDFGIAGVLDDDPDAPKTKLTQLTGRGLTLEYASPEQVTGDRTLPASDVYSLGVLLFHLCTGNRPFAASSTRAALEYAVVHSDPPLASSAVADTQPARPIPDTIAPPGDSARLKGDLDAIIQRAMRLAPAERYPTAAALAADLDAWMTGRPTSRHAGDRGYAMRLWLQRHWRFTALATVATLGIVGALAASLWQRHDARSTAHDAEQRAVRAASEARAANDLVAQQSRLNAALNEVIQRLRDELVATPPPNAEPRAPTNSGSDPVGVREERIRQIIGEAEARLGDDAALRARFREQLGRR
ncbi:MAG: serine/threonine protein kinase [Burkholderiales bacterium]|nr:serine/threonine protein kinase [Burkholderiales bacterium]